MKTSEEIRQNVRKTYAQVVDQTGTAPENTLSCCGTESKKTEFSTSCGCGQENLSPDHVSTLLGYSKADLESVPEGTNLGLGCGNPKAIAGIKEGETVVDLGSGGGFDCFLAAGRVGRNGRVIGVDMTPEMISRARQNKEKTGADNVEFRLGEIEYLPVADNSADLIISNCVINLSPEKEKVYAEAFRILKPGGRIAVSDIVAFRPLPHELQQDLTAISACIGGAATIEETIKMLEQAGLTDIAVSPKEIDPELVDSYLPGTRVTEFLTSADITAKKPMMKTDAPVHQKN